MKKNQFYCLMGVLIFMGMLISARVKAQSSMSKVPPDLQRAQKQLWKDEQQLNQARYQFALLRMKYFKINLDQKLQREKREGDPKKEKSLQEKLSLLPNVKTLVDQLYHMSQTVLSYQEAGRYDLADHLSQKINKKSQDLHRYLMIIRGR
jgi:uncharacterized membrane protein YiaA